ncbi:MAG: DUF4296 domain-containing protein [Crocinitomicaceae bacterium]|nr:DUF4296 domain-containing protein [Crocinitomicaceae bacterium]
MRKIIILVLIGLFSSCEVKLNDFPIPKDLIPKDSMTLILQDMMVLENYIANTHPEINISPDLMKKSGDSLLSTYHISPKRFESSFQYYGTQQEEMIKIYSEIQDSLTWKMNQLQVGNKD